jgi:hypothetical protein
MDNNPQSNPVPSPTPPEPTSTPNIEPVITSPTPKVISPTSSESTTVVSNNTPASQPITLNLGTNEPTIHQTNPAVQPATPNPQPISPTPTASPVISTPTSPGTPPIGGDAPMGTPTVSIVDPTAPLPKKSKIPKMKKSIFIPALILLVIIGGGLLFYFEYWLNPSVIWSNSLTDTGKGFNNLVTYLNSQSGVTYKGYNTNASLNVKVSGTTYSGSFTEQNDAANSQSTLKANIGPANLNLQTISYVEPGATTPDIYFNISGFKNLGLGQYVGINEQQLDSLDGQWISVSHSLIQQIEQSVSAQQTKTTPLTWKDVASTAQTLNTVNSKYIFTTNKNYSVTKVVKNYGFQTIDGVKTYHYKVGFVKANVKNYITALKNALTNTPVGKYATKETGDSINDLVGYSALESSADNINNSDTVDVWAGVSTRVIYKVRISDQSNPSTNYIEVGLNYKNSKSYPFFINWMSGTSGDNTNVSLLLTLNTQSNSLTGSLLATDPSDKVTVTGNANFTPTNQVFNIKPPANSITLQAAMAKIGLSSYYQEILQELSAVGSQSGGGITQSTSLLNAFSGNST